SLRRDQDLPALPGRSLAFRRAPGYSPLKYRFTLWTRRMVYTRKFARIRGRTYCPGAAIRAASGEFQSYLRKEQSCSCRDRLFGAITGDRPNLPNMELERWYS